MPAAFVTSLVTVGLALLNVRGIVMAIFDCVLPVGGIALPHPSTTWRA